MRKILTGMLLGVVLTAFQTPVLAQSGSDQVGSRAYCDAKWNARLAGNTANGETYASFLDKCLNCRAKWDEMVASGSTNGQDRSAYLRKCSGGAWWGGNSMIPEFALLGAGGIGIAVWSLGDNDGDHPVSP